MWEFTQPLLNNKMKIDRLKIDQAYLNLTSFIDTPAWIYTISDECEQCPYMKLLKIAPNDNIVIKIDASRRTEWTVFTKDYGQYVTNQTPFCAISTDDLGQFGIYDLFVTKDNCQFNIAREPVNTIISILIVILIMALVFLVSKICIYIYEKYTQRVSDESVATSTSNLDVNVPELKHPRSKSRLISLDAFRGLAIVTMIFCNCGAGKYRWLEHATWDGIHFADFIFPSFLWIMGVCIPISIKSQMAKNILKRDMIVNITKRSLKLFVIGLCIHTMHGPKLADIRIMGVLQRFGIAYFVVASVQVFFAQPILTAPETNWKKRYLDIISLTPQWAISFVLILLYFFISYGLAVPNCPRGYLGPGGIHKGGAYNHCIGGATGYIDRLLLGQRHLYQTPRVGFVYNETLPFDPEGLVGCLLTIVQVFFGVQCGTSLLIFSDWKDRLKRWTVWGICTLICGLCLGLIPYGNAIIPINKNLWSLSYVLVTSGVAFFVLSFLYCIIDVKLYWNGKPLVYAGMNAIIMYIGSEIFHKMYPFYWHIGEMNTHFSVLLQNIWTTSTWVAVAYYLYLKDIFITL